ncbi:MAG: SpoIIE family protein phosphatase [Bryobacteraceae bacterium]|nr:SpoIIE family protein phosphatase [Bryobacteraceae bacterium]
MPERQRAALIVSSPSGLRRRVPVEKTPFTIGRQGSNDLVIRDNRVSRQHARIVREPSGYFIEDIESRHGLFINEQRVSRQPLRSSDIISFGFTDSYQVKFTLEEGELGRLLDHIPASPEVLVSGTQNLAKLRAVVEVARAVQTSLSTAEVLEAVVDAALTITGSERGFLLLRENGELSVKVGRQLNGAPLRKEDLKVPAGLIQRALRERKDLLSMSFDPQAAGGLTPDASVANLELRSAVCVPLVRVQGAQLQETMSASVNDTVGLIYLDSRSDVADLSSGNRELLQSLALEASIILENARLLEQERSRQKLEEELTIARAIQQALLPKQLPSAGWLRVAGASIPSRQVGGDYFDVIQTGRDVWAIVVADVSGKGVSSALLAGLLQGAFLRAAGSAEQIREMLTRMNLFLLERTAGEKYATLFYSILAADGSLRWANAAHCQPIILRAGGEPETLESTGMPVGLLEIAQYEVRTSSLAPGDKLIVYTDGLTDARSEDGQVFGVKRLMSMLKRLRCAGCEELHQAIVEELEEFTGEAEQADDVTLLVVEYRPQ